MTLMTGVWTFKFLTLLQLISYFLIFNFNSFFSKIVLVLNGILKTCVESMSVRTFNKGECNLQNGNLEYF